MLSIDTVLLNQMASMASSANEDMEAAASILMKVVEHNDWNCAERDIINDSITGIKKDSAIVGENMINFSDALNKAASEFALLELSIPNTVQGIDMILGDLASVTNPKTTCPPVTSHYKDVFSHATIQNSYRTFETANAVDSIKICNFETFAME